MTYEEYLDSQFEDLAAANTAVPLYLIELMRYTSQLSMDLIREEHIRERSALLFDIQVCLDITYKILQMDKNKIIEEQLEILAG